MSIITATTPHDGKPVTIEKYVPGLFYNLINNDGQCMDMDDDSSAQLKTLLFKAECFVLKLNDALKWNFVCNKIAFIHSIA